ncbi:MAG: hypothetical protein LBN95_04065 [Prevotellaceae bacterium]|jgi:hypothetical protein|nr:hypothetical protein [Prevotellaceae bacterium]
MKANNIKTRENRENFKKFCEPFLALKKEGKINSVNDCLTKVYSEQGHTILKKWTDWQAEGKRIKKGAKALYLWGQKETKIYDNQVVTHYPMLVFYSENQVF